jgi:hypothetical protein
MADDTALYVSIGGLVVAALSLVVSIGSFVNAQHAKQLARQTALLDRRTKAIEQLRGIVSDLRRHRVMTSSTVDNIRAVRNRAETVFNEEIKNGLDRAIETAHDLSLRRVGGSIGGPIPPEIEALAKDLERLLQRMTEVAAVR